MIPIIASSGFLIAGVIDDLRSRKFHNWLFLTCVAIGVVIALVTGGVHGFPMALLGFTAGLAVFLPAVLLNIIGAGDMKLMAAFGLVAGWDAVLSVAVLSLIWGALFGVVAVIVRGHLKLLVYNMISIVIIRERKSLELQKIPFTIAMLMGWLCHLVLKGTL
jgi:prepilin peptidase CpaA